MVKIIGTGEHYTNVANTLVNDKRLSWKAKGIFLYLWSQAGNWHYYQKEIKNHATDGADSLRRGIAELTKYHYLRRVNTKKADGTFDGVAWLLNDQGKVGDYTDSGEIKQNPKKMCDFPQSGESAKRGKRKAENCTLTITNNNNYQNKQLLKETNKEEEHTGGVQVSSKPPKKKSNDNFSEQVVNTTNKVIDHLNQKAGTKYRPTSRATKKLIRARINDGYKTPDFYRVIDNKTSDWLNDPHWGKYLRPETLFGTKFEGYLNESVASGNANTPTVQELAAYKRPDDNIDDSKLPF